MGSRENAGKPKQGVQSRAGLGRASVFRGLRAEWKTGAGERGSLRTPRTLRPVPAGPAGSPEAVSNPQAARQAGLHRSADLRIQFGFDSAVQDGQLPGSPFLPFGAALLPPRAPGGSPPHRVPAPRHPDGGDWLRTWPSRPCGNTVASQVAAHPFSSAPGAARPALIYSTAGAASVPEAQGSGHPVNEKRPECTSKRRGGRASPEPRLDCGRPQAGPPTNHPAC